MDLLMTSDGRGVPFDFFQIDLQHTAHGNHMHGKVGRFKLLNS